MSSNYAHCFFRYNRNINNIMGYLIFVLLSDSLIYRYTFLTCDNQPKPSTFRISYAWLKPF